jgi:glycerate kinase
MSEAAGMRRLKAEEYDVDRASTFGVGEMILDAAAHNAREIILGLGGSATNDAGFGMARALGFKFFAGDRELDANVSDLQELTRIAIPSPGATRPPRDRDWAGLREDRGEGKPLAQIVAAADVRNPLLGENGATRVFGPQKGVTEDKIGIFEHALTRLADVVAKDLGFDFRNEPGAGAAGGLGFGLMSFCGAKLRSGFDVVSEAVGLESKMQDVDLVITGEGSLDRQTLEGKTPAGVARLARKLGIRVYAIVGRAAQEKEAGALFDGVWTVKPPGMSDQESIAQAAKLLHDRAREAASHLRQTLNV